MHLRIAADFARVSGGATAEASLLKKVVKSGGIPTGGLWKRTEKPTRPQLTAADANLKAPIVTFDPRLIQGMRGQKSRGILFCTKHGKEIPRRRAGKFFWSFFSSEDSKRVSIRTYLLGGRSENSH